MLRISCSQIGSCIKDDRETKRRERERERTTFYVLSRKRPYVGERVEETHATVGDRQRDVGGDPGLPEGLLELLYRLFRRLGAA
jgi:hypothetical protein